MGKIIRGDILVKKSMWDALSPAEWEALYEAYERSQRTQAISRQAAENVVKAAQAAGASGWAGGVVVVTDVAQVLAFVKSGEKLIYTSPLFSVFRDPKGELAAMVKQQDQRQRRQQESLAASAELAQAARRLEQ